MKKSPLTTVLLAILTASALTSAVLCGCFINNARQLRGLQYTMQEQVMRIQQARGAVNSLIGDTLAYSETNRAINPLLIEAGLKAPLGGAAAPKPAAK